MLLQMGWWCSIVPPVTKHQYVFYVAITFYYVTHSANITQSSKYTTHDFALQYNYILVYIYYINTHTHIHIYSSLKLSALFLALCHAKNLHQAKYNQKSKLPVLVRSCGTPTTSEAMSWRCNKCRKGMCGVSATLHNICLTLCHVVDHYHYLNIVW